MKKNKNLDELFREKLLNYEQEPPAYLLENILAGAAGARRKRKIVFWRVAGVAAAVLLAFVAGWQLKYMNSGTVDQQVVVSQNSSPKTKKAIPVVSETKTAVNKIQETQVAANETSNKTKSDKNLQVASRNIFQEKKISPAILINSRSEESTSLDPVKTLTGRINRKEQFANVLHEKKVKNSDLNLEILPIDRQIIEQNKQMDLAQNETGKKGLWLVGAQVSPAYSVTRSSHSQQYASNMLNSSSNTPVELGGGISVEYKPGKRWSLQSGVYYAGLGQTSGNSSYSKGNDFALAADRGNAYFNTAVNIDAQSSKMSMNSAAGVIEFNSIPSGIVLGANIEDKTMVSSAVVVSDARFIQNFEYIEIPLYLRYTLLDSRFDVEMLGGFSSNVLIGNDTYMESSTGKSLVGKTQDMQWMNYSGTLGLGLKYGLSKRIFLNVEPRIKYYLNSLNSNSAVTYKPYTIGVYTGISYQF
jgi:hypothetical protein